MSDYLAFKDLGKGDGAWVVPLTYGRARVVVGQIGAESYDNGW
jgi:hypothetical protein